MNNLVVYRTWHEFMKSWTYLVHGYFVQFVHGQNTDISPAKKLILLKENCILPKTCISCSLSMLWKGKSKLYVSIACIMAFIFQKLQCIKACSVRTRRNHSSFFLNDDIRIICCTFSYLTMYNSELKSFVAHSYYFFTRLKKMWQIFFGGLFTGSYLEKPLGSKFHCMLGFLLQSHAKWYFDLSTLP